MRSRLNKPMGHIAAQVKADTAAGKPGRTRVDFYLGHLAYCQPSIPKRVKYVVSDSFHSKRKWVDGWITLGWNAIGKLRQDANLNYLHQGKCRPGPARPQKYDGKVNPMDRNPAHFTLATTLSDETQLWTAVVCSVSLGRRIRLVCSVREVAGKDHYALLFSTDLDLSAEDVVTYYRARFQIEFIFRHGPTAYGNGGQSVPQQRCVGCPCQRQFNSTEFSQSYVTAGNDCTGSTDVRCDVFFD